jgi:protocatechuate 3,4-dioxygenase alpha subunit
MAEAPTPSQTVGPFFGFALPFPGDRQAVDPDAPGAIRIQGQLIDGVPDGLLEIWQGDQFARSRTDPEGVFQVVVRRPGPVPSPDGRQQAPHLNVTVFARGLLKHLNTRMYFPDEEEANAADPVLQQVDPERRHTLIARGENGVYHFDVRLQGDDETVFFAL